MTLVLALTLPMASTLALNSLYFTRLQKVYTILVLMSLGVLLGATLFIIQHPTLRDTLCGFLTGGILALSFNALLHSLFQTKKIYLFIISVLIFLPTICSYFWGLIPLNIILLIYGITVCFDFYKAHPTEEQKKHAGKYKPIKQQEKWKSEQNKKVDCKVILKRKPNIYLILMESICSADVLKLIYGMNNSILPKIFDKYNFTKYNNIFSNAHDTFSALCSLYDMNYSFIANIGLDPDARLDFLLYDILRKNGYIIRTTDNAYFLHKRSMHQVDRSPFDVPFLARFMLRYFAPLTAKSAMLRHLTGAFDPMFEHPSDADGKLLKTWLSEQPGDHPFFTFMRIGADHSPHLGGYDWRKADTFLDYYRHRYLKGMEQIALSIDAITEHDPNALIIAVGDHGACRYRNAFAGRAHPNLILKHVGLDPQLVALDYFSVPLAIKWPWPIAAPEEMGLPNGIKSHIEIFKYVLAVLGETPVAANERMENLSILWQQGKAWIAVHNGHPLKQWGTIS